MTDRTPDRTTDEASIGEKMDRVRDIVAQLEDGEVSLERAHELREEGKTLLGAVETELDLGEGSVIERE
jgi:exodeoxyribonuclease VII small subunit